MTHSPIRPSPKLVMIEEPPPYPSIHFNCDCLLRISLLLKSPSLILSILMCHLQSGFLSYLHQVLKSTINPAKHARYVSKWNNDKCVCVCVIHHGCLLVTQPAYPDGGSSELMDRSLGRAETTSHTTYRDSKATAPRVTSCTYLLLGEQGLDTH